MAHCDFQAHDLETVNLPVGLISASLPLQAIEKTAVMLARIDPISSLRQTGFRHKLAEILFGSNKANPLTDPRLEALRGFGVAIAHDRVDIVRREEAQLTKLGFEKSQINEARDIAARYRSGKPRKDTLPRAYLSAANDLLVGRTVQARPATV